MKVRVAYLLGVEVAAFLLIILESYAFFTYVVPIGPLPHDPIYYTAEAVEKIALTIGLGLVWLLVMLGLTRVYVRSRLGAPTPTPSS